MGFMDKFKEMWGATEEDFEQEFEVEQEVAQVEEEPKTFLKQKDKSSKVVNLHGTGNLQVVLVKPESFQDATTIADHLNSKHTVVLNLETTNSEVSRRLVDFLSGVAYANHGQMKKVANNTFIITPFNVDVMGDLLLDEIETSGMYF